ncbi:MAG: arginase [Haloarculaceae archaeon]
MDVRVIGVPMDLGADRRGVDMGPSAIRYAGLTGAVESLGHGCRDAGDVAVPQPGARTDGAEPAPGGRAKYLAETELVCERLAARVGAAVEADEVPLVLGGDHSIAIGTANGLADDERVGLVWFDAHGDFNTPATTPSGNVHGMSLAALLGVGPFADTDWAPAGVREEDVALVGLRDLDAGERRLLRESDAATYTMSDVDARGVAEVAAEALDRATAGTDALHVSFDMDVLDPDEAPGVGTPVRGGVTYREAHTVMEHVAAVDDLGALELVEVNPILDDLNRTAELAVELAASALGRRIL